MGKTRAFKFYATIWEGIQSLDTYEEKVKVLRGVMQYGIEGNMNGIEEEIKPLIFMVASSIDGKKNQYNKRLEKKNSKLEG